MIQERKICLFSLSQKDGTFRGAVSINLPIDWLKGKKKPPHRFYFGNSGPCSLPTGSKALFSFENQIFGEAMIKEPVRDLTATDRELPETRLGKYKKFVTLDPESIKIYLFRPTKAEMLENEKFSDYNFSRLFSYISLEQYTEILKITERKPIMPAW